MNYKISDKKLDNRFTQGRYDHLIEILNDGKTLEDLDQKTCEGIRQACLRKGYEPRTKQQDTSEVFGKKHLKLYSISIPSKQEF